jgi:NAD(P)-dependent dehydrogenase (short-subunit alcohol dehydrogenase family)
MRVLVFGSASEPLADALRARGAGVRLTVGPFGFDERPAELGHLDAIVTVAPRVRLELLEDLDPADWKERFCQYVEEPFVLVQAWLRDVLERGATGRWVAVTSVLGTQPFPSGGAVGAAAAALHTLVRIAAVEYGARGVRANAVAVGWQEGDVAETLGSDGAVRAVEDTPAGRLARVEDVAGAVAWLLSDDAAHVNGEVVRLDGAYTITRSEYVAPSGALEHRLLETHWLTGA